MGKRIKANHKGDSKKKLTYYSLLVGMTGIITVSAFFLLFAKSDEEPTAEWQQPEVNQLEVTVPKMELTKETAPSLSVPLFVYNQNIYTLSMTEIGQQHGRELLGEKLGTTRDNINDWSESGVPSEEFASTIGEQDVFTVKGYADDFRLMTYHQENGSYQASFYERLNGITIATGQQVFGKLRMAGRVVKGQYQIYSDWDKEKGHYQEIRDIEAINAFVEDLSGTVPFRRSTSVLPLNQNTMDDEDFRELVIHLEDGTKVHLIVLKQGYVYYGELYFKMDVEKIGQIWKQLSP